LMVVDSRAVVVAAEVVSTVTEPLLPATLNPGARSLEEPVAPLSPPTLGFNAAMGSTVAVGAEVEEMVVVAVVAAGVAAAAAAAAAADFVASHSAVIAPTRPLSTSTCFSTWAFSPRIESRAA